MTTLTQKESQAIRETLKIVAAIMAEIGWETRLLDLSEGQAIRLVAGAVAGFQERMQEIAKTADAEVPF